MSAVVFLLLFAGLSNTQSSPGMSGNSSGPSAFAFVDITVIDVIEGKALPSMTVVVERNKISQIGLTGKTDLPASVQQIPSAGKFLIPGLWDMHVHLGNATEAALPMLVAAGITSVRDMGTRLKWCYSRAGNCSHGHLGFPHALILNASIINTSAYHPTVVLISIRVVA